MSTEIEFTTKQEALSQFTKMFDLWHYRLSKLPEQYASTTGIHYYRSIKDDIAHLWYWQRISVDRLEAALSHTRPSYDWLPKSFNIDSEEDLLPINEWIFESTKDKSWSEILEAWHSNFLRLMSLTKEIDEPDLLEPIKFSWLDGYPLIAVLSGSYNHHVEHMDKIFLKKMV